MMEVSAGSDAFSVNGFKYLNDDDQRIINAIIMALYDYIINTLTSG